VWIKKKLGSNIRYLYKSTIEISITKLLKKKNDFEEYKMKCYISVD